MDSELSWSLPSTQAAKQLQGGIHLVLLPINCKILLASLGCWSWPTPGLIIRWENTVLQIFLVTFFTADTLLLKIMQMWHLNWNMLDWYFFAANQGSSTREYSCDCLLWHRLTHASCWHFYPCQQQGQAQHWVPILVAGSYGTSNARHHYSYSALGCHGNNLLRLQLLFNFALTKLNWFSISYLELWLRLMMFKEPVAMWKWFTPFWKSGWNSDSSFACAGWFVLLQGAWWNQGSWGGGGRRCWVCSSWICCTTSPCTWSWYTVGGWGCWPVGAWSGVCCCPCSDCSSRMDCSRFGLFHSLTFSSVLSTHNLVVHFCNLLSGICLHPEWF